MLFFLLLSFGLTAHLGAQTWRPVERNSTMLSTSPQTYGFGYQYARGHAFCEDFPEYGIWGGDMNGIRLTDTMGEKWYHPASNGLRCFGFNSVFIDPVDPNFLLAEGHMAWMNARTSPNYDAQTGIWRSTDFGVTWTLAYAVNNSGDMGYNQSTFCYDPATRTGPASARDIYKMQYVQKKGQTLEAIKLLKSLDGGATWSQIGSDLPTSWGRVYSLRHHPSNNCLYVCTEDRLLKSNAAKTTWEAVAGGLPGDKCTSISISPSGTEMYAAIRSTNTANDGIWRSSDSGVTWTNVYSTLSVRNVEVDWLSSPEIVYVLLNNGNPGLLRNTSGNGTGSWTAPSTITPMLGYEGDSYHNQLSTAGGGISDGFGGLVCPKISGVCVVNGVGRVWRTDNGGVDFRDSSQGYTGINSAARGTPLVMQRANNMDNIAIGIQDVNVAFSTNGLQSLNIKQIPLAGMSSYCIAWLRSNTLLAGQGDSQSQEICRSTNAGAGAWTFTGNSGGAVVFIGAHPTSTPEAIIAGYKISKDDGVTWPITISAGKAIGLSASGVAYVIDHATDQLIQKSTNWATAATPTFTPFFDSPVNLEKFGQPGTLVRVSQAEENTIWTKNGSNDLIRVRNTGSTYGSAVVTTFALSGQPGTLPAPYFEIADIAPDPNDANLVYVTLLASGSSHVWRGVLSGSSVTWTDITYNAPKWFDSSIHVLKDSGDVIIGGGAGSWMLPPPAGYSGSHSSRWNALATPVQPSLIPTASMAAWWMADAGVTLSGSNVSGWADQSGNGRNLTQAVSSQRPLRVTGAINGLPALSFDGNDDLDLANTIMSSAHHVFAVVKPNALSAHATIISGGSNSFQYRIESTSEAQKVVCANVGFVGLTTGTLSTTSYSQISARYAEGSGTISFFKNEVQETPTCTNRDFTAPITTVGSKEGSEFFNGYIAEIIVYTSALSTADRQAVEAYLAGKYNL